MATIIEKWTKKVQLELTEPQNRGQYCTYCPSTVDYKSRGLFM